MVRIYIESADGISVDDCERVSRQLGAVLDVEEPIRGHYTLEVSSPGLDRPLFRPAQYRQFVGATVNVRLLRAIDGRRRLLGLLRAAEDERIELEVDGVPWHIEYRDIDRARLVPEWPTHNRGRRRKSAE